jgi:hypothetical protein
LDNKSLKSSCDNLEATLKKDGKSDIDATELYMELKFIHDLMPKENMGPNEILKLLKRHDSFPNTSIPYRILLTISMTAASVERSFSKLKLLKSYLHSSMKQQRLTHGLPTGRGRTESSKVRGQGCWQSDRGRRRAPGLEAATCSGRSGRGRRYALGLEVAVCFGRSG